MKRFICVVGAALLCVAGMVAAAGASPLVFHIDPAQSQMTLLIEAQDGTVLSSAQTPGSDTTSMSGTLNVDVTGSSLQFLTTNDTQFALQGVPQSPLASGALGSAPAQFGLTVFVPDVVDGTAAARDYVGDATSGVIPLAGNAFDATQMFITLSTGVTSYNLDVLGTTYMGKYDITLPAPNELAGGTLSQVGGVYTLSIPLQSTGTVKIGGVTVLSVYTGQLVATAVVPEPGTFLLLAVGGIATLLAVKRRQRAG